jgi:ketol-acid reductoisomerase
MFLIILVKIIKNEMEFSIQQPTSQNITFNMHKYKKNAIAVTILDNGALADLYEIAKTRMFTRLHTKWQYFSGTSKKNMDEIMEDIQSCVIHDIFVTDSEFKEILSVPNDKTKTIREFINENEKFFSKSASYFTPFNFQTMYNLFVVDECAVRQMIAEQNNSKPVSMLSRYVKCTPI